MCLCIYVCVTFHVSDVNVACTCLHVRSLTWQDNMAIHKSGITARDNAVLPGNIFMVRMLLFHDGSKINVSFYVAKRMGLVVYNLLTMLKSDI